MLTCGEQTLRAENSAQVAGFISEWRPASNRNGGRHQIGIGGRIESEFAPLADDNAFAAALAPLRRSEWVVYAKRPFAGPKAVLAYLSRYTHRVAISNSRLVALDNDGVTFKWKDYRIKEGDRLKTMTLDGPEFIRRFLMHVLPSGFHRIRHYGLFASAVRARNIERIRALLEGAEASPQQQPETDGGADPAEDAHKCPCCGGRMIIIETFEGVRPARPPSPRRIRIDTS